MNHSDGNEVTPTPSVHAGIAAAVPVTGIRIPSERSANDLVYGLDVAAVGSVHGDHAMAVMSCDVRLPDVIWAASPSRITAAMRFTVSAGQSLQSSSIPSPVQCTVTLSMIAWIRLRPSIAVGPVSVQQ